MAWLSIIHLAVVLLYHLALSFPITLYQHLRLSGQGLCGCDIYRPIPSFKALLWSLVLRGGMLYLNRDSTLTTRLATMVFFRCHSRAF